MPTRQSIFPACPLRYALSACVAVLAVAPLPAAAGELAFKPTGVLFHDIVASDSDEVGDTRDHKLRLARVGFSLGDGEHWKLMVEHEMTDRSSSDAYLQLTIDERQSLRLGQFKQPFQLENATSARQTPLMEASLIGAFGIGRRIGFDYTLATDDSTLEAAVFGKSLDGGNEGIGMAVRGTHVVMRDAAQLLHVGLAVAADRPDAETARFSSRPESALVPQRLVDTGTLAGARQIVRGGVETVWIRGPWSVQAELARVGVDAADGDFAGHGGYAMASWSPSGHTRSYKRGTVGAPSLDGGDAWELFLRYGTIDLDHAGIRGGEQDDWTLGATWHVNPHVRLMANYVHADSERDGIAADMRVLQFRTQLAF